MRFQIPQFIDVEDKIFGPFTLKQFIYLAGGASIALACVTIFGLVLGLMIASPIIILAVALAFYKVNNRPFINMLESAFKYLTKDKLYIWQKSEKTEAEIVAEEKKYSSVIVPNLGESKLKDMNWQLDVKKKEDALLNNNK